MKLAVLASGSRANCSFVEFGAKRFLIDCGLTAKQIELRLDLLGIPASSLEAIIISHEHRDHTIGASVLSRRYEIPVYANQGTADFLENVYGVEYFETGKPFSLGSVSIRPFRIVHDAVDPVGFVVQADGIKLTHVTDLGKVTPLVEDAMHNAHAIVLESNYDKEMLQTCEYPWELKQRIASSHGHLGNTEAASILERVYHSELCHVVLAHLSENSNSEELALQASRTKLAPLGFQNVRCGNPRQPTELLTVDETPFSIAI